MIGYIYVIKNRCNNKVYIGQTRTSIDQRWKEHLRDSKRCKYTLYNAMRKYGVENFYIEQLDVCDVDILDEMEISYIKKFKSTDDRYGYNISTGGKTPQKEKKFVDEDLVVDLYCNKKKTLAYVSDVTGVSRYIITNILRRKNRQIRDRHISNIKFLSHNKDEILIALKQSTSLRSAAKLLNMPYSSFRKACIYYQIEYNPATSVRHQASDENVC